MPTLPIYQDDDSADLADHAYGQKMLQDALAGIRFQSALPDALEGIKKVAASFNPLPIIVSDRPGGQQYGQPSGPRPVAMPDGTPSTPSTPTTPVTPGSQPASAPVSLIGQSSTDPGGTAAAMPTGGAPVAVANVAPQTQTGGAIDNSSRESFSRTAYPMALSAAGGDPELAKRFLAMAISENGTVGSGGAIGVGNNFGGIKYDPQASGSGNYGTWESEGGHRVNQNANFAAYASPQDGFNAIPRFIQTNFPQAWAQYQQDHDAAGLIRAINAGGYATNPTWHQDIEGIVANNVAPVVGAQPAPQASAAPQPDQLRTALNAGRGQPTSMKTQDQQPSDQTGDQPSGQPWWTPSGFGQQEIPSQRYVVPYDPQTGHTVDPNGVIVRQPPAFTAPPRNQAVPGDQYDETATWPRNQAVPGGPIDETGQAPIMYRQPLGATMGPDTNGTDQPAPTSSYNDPTDTGTLSQPLPPQDAAPASYGASGDEQQTPAYQPPVDDGYQAVPMRPAQGNLDITSVQDTGANDYPPDQYQETAVAPPRAPVAQGQPAMLPVWDANGQKVGYRQEVGDTGAPTDPTISDPNYTQPAGRQYDPNDPSTGVNPNAPGSLRPTDLPPESQGARPWLPATTPAGGIQAPPGLVDSLVPRAAQTGPQFEGPAAPSRWSPAFQAQYGQGGEAAPFQDDQREPGYRPTPAPRVLSPYQPGSGNAMVGVETPPSDQQILQGQGSVARSIDTADTAIRSAGVQQVASNLQGAPGPVGAAASLVHDYGRGSDQPIVQPSLADAGTFMNGQPDTAGALLNWRDRLTVGAADAVARGIGQDPEHTVAQVTIAGHPLKMTVSDLLQNFTDPLFIGGAGVGQVVLDGVGEAALRAVAPYAKGAAKAVIQRILDTGRAAADTIDSGIGAAQGAGTRIRGALDANAERVAAADARAAAQGSTQLPGTLGVVTGNLLEANTAVGTRVIPPHVSDTLDFPVRVPTDPSVVRAIEAAGGSVDPERGVNLNVIRYQGPEAHGRPATRSSTFYTAGKPGEASPYATSGKGAQVGGTDRIEAPTTYRSPLVLSEPPGSNRGFDEGMRQIQDPRLRAAQDAYDQATEAWNAAMRSGAPNLKEVVDAAFKHRQQAADALNAVRSQVTPVTSGVGIDTSIRTARAAGPPGSPERAQALKDLVSRYGGDPGVVDELLAVRGADDSESAWAIKENILAHNARARGYDGVLTVQPQDVPSSEIEAHPAVKQASDALDQTVKQLSDANAEYNRTYDEYGKARVAAMKVHGMETPDTLPELQPSLRAIEQAKAKVEAAGRAHDAASNALSTASVGARRELARGKITELADFRESHNPTPGERTPAYLEVKKRRDLAANKLEGLRAYRDRPDLVPEIESTRTELAHLNQVLQEMGGGSTYVNEPGYTLRSDLPVRPTGGPETASATAGVVPGGSRGAGALNAVTTEAGRVIAGGVGGGTIGAGLPADTPEERRRNTLIGAGVGMVAGPLASRAIRSEGGALATFGASPNYRPPTAAQLKAAERQGARRGEMLNRPVTAPGTAVPRTVRAATAATDDRAGLRWAEDMLSEAAGSPRMRENDPARPSTQSRVNAGSVANERIATGLEPAIQDAGAAGLQHELPQYLEDTHQKDILDAFYTKGKQAVLDDRAQKIAAAQARGASPAVIARMQAKAAADAEAAGTAAMRKREGGSTDMTYSAIEARLQAQDQRVTAAGKKADLDAAAQAVWDHNAETRQRLVDSGNLDPQVAADLAAKYPHYVPTVPISHLTEGAGPVASSSVAVSRGTKPSISALDDVGTSGERLNPIVASRNQTISAERDIQRNNVARAFAQMMDDATAANPAATATIPATHRTFLGGGVDVHYFENGQPRTISVPKTIADGLEAAANMGVSANGVTSFLKRVTGIVTSTLTAARASFVPVNVARDASDYATRTMVREGNNPAHLPAILGTWADEAGKAALDILAANRNGRTAIGAATGFGAGAMQGDDNTPLSTRLVHGAEGAAAGALLIGANKVQTTGKAAEYLARGGGSGGAVGSLKAGQRWYRDVLRDGGAPLKSPGEALRYLGDWAHDVVSLQGIKGINERAETISRTAAMRRAEARGANPVEAMIAGRDSSYDPDRAGTVTRAWNGFIPFLNATVQGGAQFTRMMKQNPVGTTAAITSTLGPVMLATEYWNRSDPQRAQAYDDVPQYVKDSGIVLMMPGAGGSDTRGSKPNYLWLPTEVLTPFVVGMRAAMQHADAVVPGMAPSAGRSDANPNSVAPQSLGALNEALSVFYPVRGDSAASIGSTFVPPIARQFIELGQNKDLFRGGTISSPSQDERASGFGHAVANAANAAGRAIGNQTLQEVTPSHVDYLARQVPAYGDIITGASDMVKPSPYKQAEQGRLANEPFVGGIGARFVRDTGGANLERAQGQAMTPAVQSALASARMHPSEIDLTVPADWKNAPLTRQEQNRWQRAFDSTINQEIAMAKSTQEWATPVTRKEAVKSAVTNARNRAAEIALSSLSDTEIQQRQQRAQRMQRQATGVR